MLSYLYAQFQDLINVPRIHVCNGVGPQVLPTLVIALPLITV